MTYESINKWLKHQESLEYGITEEPWMWHSYGNGGKTLAYPNDPFHELNVLKTTDDWPPNLYDAEFIASVRSSAPKMRRALEAVLSLHRPFKIYDECNCDNKDDFYHTYVENIGWTCVVSYYVCGACCIGDGYQSEECVNHHNHGDLYSDFCPTGTVRAIQDAIRG